MVSLGLIGALIVLGLQSFLKMPAEQDPRVEFPFITVSTVYTNKFLKSIFINFYITHQ